MSDGRNAPAERIDTARIDLHSTTALLYYRDYARAALAALAIVNLTLIIPEAQVRGFDLGIAVVRLLAGIGSLWLAKHISRARSIRQYYAWIRTWAAAIVPLAIVVAVRNQVSLSEQPMLFVMNLTLLYLVLPDRMWVRVLACTLYTLGCLAFAPVLASSLGHSYGVIFSAHASGILCCGVLGRLRGRHDSQITEFEVICMHCRRFCVNHDWARLESRFPETMFSHGLCPTCHEEHFGLLPRQS